MLVRLQTHLLLIGKSKSEEKKYRVLQREPGVTQIEQTLCLFFIEALDGSFCFQHVLKHYP